MNPLSWILFGLIVGIIANMLDTTSRQSNILSALLFGVTGALAGGVLATLIFRHSWTGFSLTSFLMAAIVSLLLLILARAFKKV